MSERPSRRAVLGGAAAAGLAALAVPATASATPGAGSEPKGRGRFAGKVVAITGATTGIVRAAALDYGSKGIRVLAADPGTTDTRLAR